MVSLIFVYIGKLERFVSLMLSHDSSYFSVSASFLISSLLSLRTRDIFWLVRGTSMVSSLFS